MRTRTSVLSSFCTLAAAAVAGPRPALAWCGEPHPIMNSDTYFTGLPDGYLEGWAYIFVDPAVNSGAAGASFFYGAPIDGEAWVSGWGPWCAGTADDGHACVQGDWSNPGVEGCPVFPQVAVVHMT